MMMMAMMMLMVLILIMAIMMMIYMLESELKADLCNQATLLIRPLFVKKQNKTMVGLYMGNG